MTILIIEDEELTARKLQRLLTDLEPMATIVGTTVSVDDSVAWLQTHEPPDLIFMDVELADGQSFEIFNQVAVRSPVIFTTAYDEYAIKAFKVNSIDYLLKPVREADLRQALAKLQAIRRVLTGSQYATGLSALEAPLTNLLDYLRHAAPEAIPALPGGGRSAAAFRERFMIKQGQRLFSVTADEVAYIFSRNKLSFLKTRDNHDWMVDYTIDELSQMLDPHRFFRLNRQVIAGLRAIDTVHLNFNGKLKIILQPVFDEEVIVSREKAGEFRRWLGE